ncbi:hypothetical protein GJ496_001897 [Pomphorhynchus laevis]|nr:hypothetical protein GJ496_001897 [Pomphorhynchus laevis]
MCQALDSSEDSDSLATRLQIASEKIKHMRQLDMKEVFRAISEECDPDRKIALEHATVKGVSSWLNILPSEYHDFRLTPPSQISASNIFSKYYRGVLIDEGNVSSDLQGTLGISKALAGYLTSAVTMGPAEISWKAFMLSDGSVNLISLDPLAADVVHSASDILHTIEAGQLVLNNSEYTLAELAIVRLIANGLPRFASPADAINIPILDNIVTLRFDVTILYHGAVPVIPFAVLTCYSIGSILTKLAFKTSTIDDCLSGLVMAIAVSFFYQGQGNLNCIVNAFAEYRRLNWPRLIFKNLLYAWLRLNNQTKHIAEKLELASALKVPLVEIVQSFILTNMIISTATGTIFHRWSASANLLQMYMTRAANVNYGSAAVYLEAHLEAPYNETSASFFSAVYLAIKDICYDDLPFGAYNISRWNGGRGFVNADLANNEAWIGGWDRIIVYPCQPYTVLGLTSLGRQFGGTCVLQLHLVLARSVTLGDDLFMERIRENEFFLTTGYTPTVLSAISQNCRVDAWNRPQFIMFDCDQRQDIPLPAETIEPALVYDAAASLVVVGTMWHFDWFRQQGFGIRWDCNQLPTRVRILIEYKATHLLVAGVNATGDGTVFSATGRPSNLKKKTRHVSS